MEYSANNMIPPYYPSKTITKIFIQIEKVVQIANTENTPFKNAQIIFKAYILVHKTVYTVNNAKPGITVQQQKNMALLSHPLLSSLKICKKLPNFYRTSWIQ